MSRKDHCTYEALVGLGLNQPEAADVISMVQPKVLGAPRYKLQNISLERLMQAPVSLWQYVEIFMQPVRSTCAAGITVAA